MSGFTKSLIDDSHFGAAVLSLSLATAFFLLTGVLSMFDGGFILTIAIIMCAAGVVSTVFFFWALGSLFERIT